MLELALRAGGDYITNPDLLLQRMRPSQLAEWAALWMVDPQGEARADLRAGVIASVIANVHRDSKKRPRPFKASDFMLQFGPDERPKKSVRQAMREWFPERYKSKQSGSKKG